MMPRKFKLIKEYPGSPPKGSIAHRIASTAGLESYSIVKPDRHIIPYVSPPTIEEWPDYWEPIEDSEMSYHITDPNIKYGNQ